MGLISASVRLLTNARPFDVSIVDANGDHITNFGGALASGSTATITAITPSGTSVQLLAANANRKHFYVSNDTQRSLRVAFAATASLAAYTALVPARSQEKFVGYTGVVSGIWDNNPNGTCTVTEVV